MFKRISTICSIYYLIPRPTCIYPNNFQRVPFQCLSPSIEIFFFFNHSSQAGLFSLFFCFLRFRMHFRKEPSFFRSKNIPDRTAGFWTHCHHFLDFLRPITFPFVQIFRSTFYFDIPSNFYRRLLFFFLSSLG